MTHLGDEDIARLIDGTVSDAERKVMLEHMADCESCLSIYNETITFLEEEGELKEVVELEPEQKGHVTPMRRRAWLSVAAVLALFLVGIYIVIDILPNAGLTHDQGAMLENRIEKIWNPNGHHFTDPNNKEFAAVRIGIWMVDLCRLYRGGKHADLKKKYGELLVEDLGRFLPAGDSLLVEAAGLSKKTYGDVEVNVQMKLDGFGMGDLYQMGRFIENALLAATERELPALEELSHYLEVAKDHQLPQGVSRLLPGLSKTTDPAALAEICGNVIDIFFD